MKIPVYRLPYSKQDIEFVNNKIADILSSGYLTDGGPVVSEFEDLWSQFVGAKNSISVNSCTTGLEAVLSCLDIKGKSVVVPNYTFYATPMSVINEGGKVLFADISKRNLSITLDSIKKVVRPDTAAVIIVHVAGIVSEEIFEIKKYCDDNNIFLLEDAACAAGSKIKGKSAGTIGHAGVFSFHHSKVLTTGEGGMICTNSDVLAKELKRSRAIGLDRSVNNYEVFRQGSNYKMSEITAALGVLHTHKADQIIKDRRELAKYYDNNIKFCNKLRKFNIHTDCYSSYYKYIVEVEFLGLKDKIKEKLESKFSIFLPPTVYNYNCNLMKFSKHPQVLNQEDSFPESKYSSNHLLCLNMFNGITDAERKYIVDSINKVIASL